MWPIVAMVRMKSKVKKIHDDLGNVILIGEQEKKSVNLINTVHLFSMVIIVGDCPKFR